MRYTCDKCKFDVATKSSLKKHIERKHESVKYPCDKLKYLAPKAIHLRVHVQNKRESDRYL